LPHPALLLGILAGFRPETLVSMLPLPVIAALRSRLARHFLLSGMALGAGMASWLIPLIIRTGGFAGFLAMLRMYSAEQAGASSLLFGAGWDGAARMIAEGLWWASLGIASWCFAILLVRWRRLPGDPHYARSFLLTWFLAQFLFSIVVHIAASGHSLGFIPVMCLAGGWVLSRVGTLIAIPALALNVLLFFHPYSSHVREASYETMASIIDANEATLA
jgi:hypothetical protein